ncbi:MAG: rhomboid family intramembrane serine protease [Gemmatimonadetes bacterium]|nr:rhomboid family intramembrane serine protease [Gemmatimonadota bacterium]
MFPYRDENPTVLTPYVTVGFIALNVLSWLFLQGAGFSEQLPRSVCELGLIPGELLGRAPPGSGIELAPGLVCVVEAHPKYWTLLTSMFMHGGWAHLFFNMMFLWVFGNNIEDAMGHVRFVVFYLLCGVAAAAAQVFVSPTSPIPMVGASGAISGVLGGYLLLYPRVRVHTLIFLGFFVTTVALPAYVMLGYWILLQLLGGLPALAGVESGGVAFWAHIGGFVAGLGLVRLFAKEENLLRRPHPVFALRDWR